MNGRTSWKKAIKNDYIIMLSIISMIVLTIFVIMTVIFNIGITKNDGVIILDVDTKIILGIIYIALFCLCFLFLVTRLQNIHEIMANGIELEAEIIGIYFYRDRGRIDYQFDVDGITYKDGQGIHLTRETEKYKDCKIGEKITILVNSKKGKASIIKELVC